MTWSVIQIHQAHGDVGQWLACVGFNTCGRAAGMTNALQQRDCSQLRSRMWCVGPTVGREVGVGALSQ